MCDSDTHFLTVKLTGQTWLMRMPKKHAFNNMQRAFAHEEIKRSFTRITVDFSPNMTAVISVCLQSLLSSRYNKFCSNMKFVKPQTLINAVWVASDPSAINKYKTVIKFNMI